MKFLQAVAHRVLVLFLPERCVLCGTVVLPGTVCCEECRRTLSLVYPPICRWCGQNETDCCCQKRHRYFDGQAAPFYHEGAAKKGVLRLKKWDSPEAVSFFAEQMAAVVHREYDEEEIDGIVFVPMTKHELAERGYNQGQLLAEALGKQLNLPVCDLLVKLYETNSQKNLKGIERSGNILGVFDVNVPSVAGKTFLLVDDVMTTGATAGECAKMLKNYGAERVLCVTAAVRRLKKEPTETSYR